MSGESFEWRGREVRVTPKPITDPRRMLFVGGGVPAAARRAARLRLAMFPIKLSRTQSALFSRSKIVKIQIGGRMVLICNEIGESVNLQHMIAEG